jgi:predicted nucleic acid-binding protein
MEPVQWLLDTNILLRLSKRDRSDVRDVRKALHLLYLSKAKLCYTSQNLREFWSVATRPATQNGFGLSLREADREARRIERIFRFLSDNEMVHREWRRLVKTHSVLGTQVHDANLVAAMKVHGVTYLLTSNVHDFSRYTDITAVHPTQVPAHT